MREKNAFLKEGTGKKGRGQEPLNFTRTTSKATWVKCFMFCILSPPLPPPAAIVHCGAFSSLLSSCDECSLIACIDSPSEALAWFLINPPSGCSVLSGHSAPYLLVQFNELVEKTCWYKIHIYWIWLSWACPWMSNLVVLVAGITLDYCVTVLLTGSLFAHFFGQEVIAPLPYHQALLIGYSWVLCLVTLWAEYRRVTPGVQIHMPARARGVWQMRA